MKQRTLFLTRVVSSAIGISLVIGLSVGSDAWAAKKNRKEPDVSKRRFPHGCRMVGFDFDDNTVMLRSSKPEGESPQTLYLIHNVSDRAIYLKAKKTSDQPFMLSYPNVVNVGEWGAFATDFRHISFSCTAPAGVDEGNQPIRCAGALDICQYDNVKFSATNGGNYWIVKSDTLRNAMYGAIGSGILLRW